MMIRNEFSISQLYKILENMDYEVNYDIPVECHYGKEGGHTYRKTNIHVLKRLNGNAYARYPARISILEYDFKLEVYGADGILLQSSKV